MTATAGRVETVARWLLLATTVLLGFRWFPSLGFIYPTAQVSDVTLLAGAIAWLASGRAWHFLRGNLPLAGLAGAWWLAGVAAVVLHPYWRDAEPSKLSGQAGLVGLLFMAADFGTDAGYSRQLARALCAGAALALVAGLVGALLYFAGVSTPLLNHHGDLVAGNYPRIRGFMAHSNALANLGVCAVILLAAAPELLSKGMRRALLGVAAAALPFTLSRALVALAVALAGLRARSWRGWIAFALVAGVGLAMLYATARYRILLSPIAPLDVHLTSEPGLRWRIWTAAVAVIARHPFIGQGFAPFALTERGMMEGHNLVLGTWVERGLIGLMPLVVLIAGALWRAGRAAMPLPTSSAHANLYAWGLFWLLCALVLEGLSLSVANQRQFWLVLGLCYSVRR